MEQQTLLPYYYGDANISTKYIVISWANQEAGLGYRPGRAVYCLGPAGCGGVVLCCRSQPAEGVAWGGITPSLPLSLSPPHHHGSWLAGKV